jgi:peptidoglycan/xylan/chitin deacetylase (PgdA/CDA1 family)
MLRSLVKTATARALSRSKAAGLIRSLNGWRHTPLVLGYHRVVEDFDRELDGSIPAMLISSRMLERHLDWVGRRYSFLSLDDVCSRLESGQPFAKPAALLTFDDGYEDVYHFALPLLRRKGIPAAVFVVTGLIDSDRPQVHDELYLLVSHAMVHWQDPVKRIAQLCAALGIAFPDTESQSSANAFLLTGKLLNLLCREDVVRLVSALQDECPQIRCSAGLRPLTWEMLQEMQRSGFGIGSHTKSHALLTNEPTAVVFEELKASRLALETHLGRTSPHFAYPDGKFNSSVVEAVRSCGYRFAFSTCAHRDSRHPLLTIPRKVLWERSSVDRFGRFDAAVMECQITRLFDFLAPCTQEHRLPDPLPGLNEVQAHARLEHS